MLDRWRDSKNIIAILLHRDIFMLNSDPNPAFQPIAEPHVLCVNSFLFISSKLPRSWPSLYILQSSKNEQQTNKTNKQQKP